MSAVTLNGLTLTTLLRHSLHCHWFSRVMDSKWGGKTETINMQLNVEQVFENLKMYFYYPKDQANYQPLDGSKSPDSTCRNTLLRLLPYSLIMVSCMYLPYLHITMKLTEYAVLISKITTNTFLHVTLICY